MITLDEGATCWATNAAGNELAVGFACLGRGVLVEVGTSSRTGPSNDDDIVPAGRAVVG